MARSAGEVPNRPTRGILVSNLVNDRGQEVIWAIAKAITKGHNVPITAGELVLCCSTVLACRIGMLDDPDERNRLVASISLMTAELVRLSVSGAKDLHMLAAEVGMIDQRAAYTEFLV